MDNFFQSKSFKKIIIVVGILAVIFVSFAAGIFVGYHKARFSYAWGENYDRNFGGPHHGIFGMQGMMPMGPDGFMSAHGTFGSILGINAGSSTLVISGQDNMEKTVIVSTSTALRENRNTIVFSDFKVNEPVVVIGAPNDKGQIEAQLVRVLQ